MNSAEDFLSTGQKFHLGFLETEQPHPKTVHLAEWAQNNLPEAIRQLVEIDCEALDKLKSHVPLILGLRESLRSTWEVGGRVFLCGCGATGRLSLTLESLYRESVIQSGRDGQAGEEKGALQNRVVAFMAGGDVALVHSLEGFEDFPEYGARHLRELGFCQKDLLVACTEGGETPYVIGAVEAASEISQRPPYFLYCNPDEVLCRNVERSRRIIENPKIQKINLTVGPMALAGSTRMQASTVLQLAVGFALLTQKSQTEITESISLIQSFLRENAAPFLQPFIEKESAEYQSGRYILYCVRDYGITVFTDTTERAPTFSLTPFSHKKATRLLSLRPSLCYVSLPEAETSAQAWNVLLRREPRPLNWVDVDDRTGEDYLGAFDFSMGAREYRKWLTNNAEHSDFEILRHEGTLLWRFQDIETGLLLPAETFPLFEHTLLKMLLNIHSTLIMGRLGRYKNNLMTWVYPTNGKLIDRASRYVKTLLSHEGMEVTYEQAVKALFDVKPNVTANQSIVLAACGELKKTDRL